MNNVNTFKNFFLFKEAIRLKDVKKKMLFKNRGGAYKIDSLKEVFGNKDRIFYPLKLSGYEVGNYNPLIFKINDLFEKHYNNDFIIKNEEDYKKGIVYSKSDFEKKQPRKIGRLLNSINSEESKSLLDAFKKDPSRSAKDDEYFVVFSRHPYDIAGMSTDRNWRSCMTLEVPNVVYKDENRKNRAGINKRYVENDIKEGSIVAYLVSSSEMNSKGKIEIRRPLSRILLKPFKNVDNKNEIVYSLGRMYGANISKFSNFVKEWLIKNINKNTSGKKYTLKGDLYPDGDITVNFEESNRNDSMGNRIFFEVLNSRIDNSKYENFFEILTLYNDRTDSELKITFEIPKEIPLDDFYYERGGYPNYIKEILNLKTLPDKGIIQSVQSFLNSRSIVIEYRFSGNSLTWEDEKGNEIPLDEYDAEEMFSDTFIGDGSVNRIDYKNARKSILEILKKFDINSEREIEKSKLVQYLNSIFEPDNPAISPNLKEGIKTIDNGYNDYLMDRDYFLSIDNVSLEELSEISKSEEYKSRINRVHQYMRNYINTLGRMSHLISHIEREYPILRSSAKTIWNEILNKRFPLRENVLKETGRKNIVEYIKKLQKYSETHSKEEYDYIKDVLEDQDTAFNGKTYSLERA